MQPSKALLHRFSVKDLKPRCSVQRLQVFLTLFICFIVILGDYLKVDDFEGFSVALCHIFLAVFLLSLQIGAELLGLLPSISINL